MTQPQFRLRGQQMNRIEAVSDVVFGFALTLLVVSLEVPRTYADLIRAMIGFPAFAITFAALMVVWARHYYFYRYYGLDDLPTIVLNTILLFLVLFYVYPLKFLFNVFLFNVWLSPLTGAAGNASAGLPSAMTWSDVRGLEIIFGSGFAAIYLVFAAMYWHANRMRDTLNLSNFEIAYTRTAMISQLLNVGVGLLSIAIAAMLKLRLAGLAGYVYFLLPAISLWRLRAHSLDRREAEAA